MTRTHKIWSFALLLAAFGLQGCSKDVTSEVAPITPDPVAAKMLFTSENAAAGELLICFNDEALATVEAVTTRSEVATRSGVADFDEALELIGTRSIKPLFPVDPRHEARQRAAGLHRWYVVEFDDNEDLDRAAASLATSKAVDFVQFNQNLVHIQSDRVVEADLMNTRAQSVNYPDFNDPQLDSQWHYINVGDTSLSPVMKAGADVNLAAAWKLCTGDPRVIVAVVDNGVDWEHEDLAENMWVNPREESGASGTDDDSNGFTDDVHGYNFATDGPLKVSTQGDGAEHHGTHVAGTVAAVNNNGTGVCGVAGGSGNGDGVRIMSCQIFYNYLSATSAMSAKAAVYAADNGASILQCSYGYPTAGGPQNDAAYTSIYSAEQVAHQYFLSVSNCAAVDGGLIIYAAGNDAYSHSCYPGAYRDYLSVAAMSCDYTPAYYSCYGPGVNITAPGGDAYQSESYSTSMVLSCLNNDRYGWEQGTSMACPHVSGVAALGLSYALKMGKSYSRLEFMGLLTTSVNGIDQYCTGSKRGDGGVKVDLTPHKGQMGSGYIDAYQLLMNIRGASCVPVAVGKQYTLNIKEYIGDGNATMQIKTVSVSDEDKARLGMTSDPTIFGDQIMFTCSKVGSGALAVTLQSGTSNGEGISGMDVTKEFAIIAREFAATNGGWL